MFINSFHQLVVSGKLIKDIELHYTDRGTPIVKFSLPTNNVYRNLENESVTETTWFEVILQNATAEAASKVLRKGDYVQIIGRLNPEVKIRELKNGRTVGIYEVLGDEAVFFPRNGYKNDDR